MTLPQNLEVHEDSFHTPTPPPKNLPSPPSNRIPPPKPPPKCPDPTAPVRTFNNNPPKPLTDLSNVLEPEGFPDTLGEPTFENIRYNKTPIRVSYNPYIQTKVPETSRDCCEERRPEPATEEPATEEPMNEDPQEKIQYTSGFTFDGLTPEDIQINQITATSQQAPNILSQDPDGIRWLFPSPDQPIDHWPRSKWDTNKTPMKITNTTTADEVCDFITPSNVYALKGLRELFYEVKPFADNTAPTPAEINSWHLEVITHIRALLGSTTPIQNDARLYLEARWATERKWTKHWDADYPNTSVLGDLYGPCFNSAGAAVDEAQGHCGEAFFPSHGDDYLHYIKGPPYNDNFDKYPELLNYNSKKSETTGLSQTNLRLPWSIRLASIICKYICLEGLSGHAGPFLGDIGIGKPDTKYRTHFGCSWILVNGGTDVAYRGKWF